MDLDTGTVAIVMVFAIPLTAIIGGLALEAFKIWRGGNDRRDKKAQADEARMIQEMYSHLTKMEERIETLESLLIERSRKESTL